MKFEWTSAAIVLCCLVLLCGRASAEGRWDGLVRRYPSDVNNHAIVGVFPDGRDYVLLKKQRKPVQGQGSIDSLVVSDVSTGSQRRTILEPRGEEKDQFDEAALSPDGKLVVTGNWHGWVVLYEVDTAKEIGRWQESFRFIQRVAFSTDGARFATATLDDVAKRHVIHLYDVATKEKIATFAGHADGVNVVRFLPDGRLISGGRDELICIWDPAAPLPADTVTPPAPPRGDGANARRLPVRPPAIVFRGHKGYVNSVDVSPSTGRVISGGQDGRIGVWDLSTGQLLRLFRAHGKDVFDREYVGRVFFLKGGTQFISSGSDSIMNLWDVETGQRLADKRGGAGVVHVLPDGEQAIVHFSLHRLPTGYAPTEGNSVPTNEAVDWKPATVIGPIKDGLWGMQIKPHDGGKTIAVATRGTNARSFTSFDRTTGKQTKSVETPRQPDGTGQPLAYSPDGKRIVCGGDKGELSIVDVVTGAEILQLVGQTRLTYSAAWSPDGKQVFTAEGANPGDDNKADIYVWNAIDGSLVRKLAGSRQVIWALAVSADGQFLIAGNGGHADGKFVDCAVRQWNLATGEQVASFIDLEFPVVGIAISPDGKTAASGGQQGPVILWDLAARKELRRVAGAQNRDGNMTVRALAFSPDGRRLATGGADSDVAVWDVATGTEVHRLEDHRKAIHALQWIDDGTLVSASADATIRVWAIDVLDAESPDGR